MKVIGRTKIFKNEYNGNAYYTTSISNKKEDGSWENLYVGVQFKKGMEIEGNIDITNSFLTFYKDKNGVAKIKIVIMEYTKVCTEANTDDFVTVENTSNLPF